MGFRKISAGECAEKLRCAKKIAVLTGAGMSTAAGVPDFRGPQGLYVTRRYDPETVFDINYFDRDPKPFYQFSRDFLALLRNIEPTFTHRFLAQLEAGGRDLGLVTQNIDGLHQKAGSKNVYPMHGDYETAHCRHCRKGYSGREVEKLLEEMAVPTCGKCGGVIKPDVVFFGENVRHLPEANALAEASDVMLVLGSSLTVFPAAGLPYAAGGEVIIVNQGQVGMRESGNVYLAEAGLDDFFQEVAEAMAVERKD